MINIGHNRSGRYFSRSIGLMTEDSMLDVIEQQARVKLSEEEYRQATTLAQTARVSASIAHIPMYEPATRGLLQR
jgi:hypothetical protein